MADEENNFSELLTNAQEIKKSIFAQSRFIDCKKEFLKKLESQLEYTKKEISLKEEFQKELREKQSLAETSISSIYDSKKLMRQHEYCLLNELQQEKEKTEENKKEYKATISKYEAVWEQYEKTYNSISYVQERNKEKIKVKLLRMAFIKYSTEIKEIKRKIQVLQQIQGKIKQNLIVKLAELWKKRQDFLKRKAEMMRNIENMKKKIKILEAEKLEKYKIRIKKPIGLEKFNIESLTSTLSRTTQDLLQRGLNLQMPLWDSPPRKIPRFTEGSLPFRRDFLVDLAGGDITANTTEQAFNQEPGPSGDRARSVTMPQVNEQRPQTSMDWVDGGKASAPAEQRFTPDFNSGYLQVNSPSPNLVGQEQALVTSNQTSSSIKMAEENTVAPHQMSSQSSTAPIQSAEVNASSSQTALSKEPALTPLLTSNSRQTLHQYSTQKAGYTLPCQLLSEKSTTLLKSSKPKEGEVPPPASQSEEISNPIQTSSQIEKGKATSLEGSKQSEETPHISQRDVTPPTLLQNSEQRETHTLPLQRSVQIEKKGTISLEKNKQQTSSLEIMGQISSPFFTNEQKEGSRSITETNLTTKVPRLGLNTCPLQLILRRNEGIQSAKQSNVNTSTPLPSALLKGEGKSLLSSRSPLSPPSEIRKQLNFTPVKISDENNAAQLKESLQNTMRQKEKLQTENSNENNQNVTVRPSGLMDTEVQNNEIPSQTLTAPVGTATVPSPVEPNNVPITEKREQSVVGSVLPTAPEYNEPTPRKETNNKNSTLEADPAEHNRQTCNDVSDNEHSAGESVAGEWQQQQEEDYSCVLSPDGYTPRVDDIMPSPNSSQERASTQKSPSSYMSPPGIVSSPPCTSDSENTTNFLGQSNKNDNAFGKGFNFDAPAATSGFSFNFGGASGEKSKLSTVFTLFN